MDIRTTFIRSVSVLFVILIFSTSVYGAERGIAELTAAEGDVMVKNLGNWGKTPKIGLVLFAGDKIVTTSGNARVRFYDGAVLEVQPNSNVLITDRSEEKNVKKKREIQLFLGKIKYKSGPQSATETKLYSRTAVAALRGTEVWFGTDGLFTFLNRLEGGSENQGNITEGFVPDILPEKADQDTLHQASINAAGLWKQYERERRAFFQAKTDQQNRTFLLASISDWMTPVLFTAFENKQNTNPIGYARLMTTLANAVRSGVEEEIQTADAMQNHLDKELAKRAQMALIQSKQALDAVNKAVQLAQTLVEKIETIQNMSVSAERKNALNALVIAAIKSLESKIDVTRAGNNIAALFMNGSAADALEAAKTILERVQFAANKTSEADRKTRDIVNRMVEAQKSGNEKVAEILGKAAETQAAEASAYAGLAEAGTNLGLVAMSGGDVSEAQKVFDLAEKESQKTGQLAEKASTIADNMDKTDSPPTEEEMKIASDGLDGMNILAQAQASIASTSATIILGEASGQPTQNLQNSMNAMADQTAKVEESVNKIANDLANSDYLAAKTTIEDSDYDTNIAAIPSTQEDLEKTADEVNQLLESGETPPTGGKEEPMPTSEEETTTEEEKKTSETEETIVKTPQDKDSDGYYAAPDGNDCDDTKASVHPGAVEICGDGIDQNCDGSDLKCTGQDKDGDGYTDSEGDCNDLDPDVHPNATEICGDGVDQNCDATDCPNYAQ